MNKRIAKKIHKKYANFLADAARQETILVISPGIVAIMVGYKWTQIAKARNYWARRGSVAGS